MFRLFNDLYSFVQLAISVKCLVVGRYCSLWYVRINYQFKLRFDMSNSSLKLLFKSNHFWVISFAFGKKMSAPTKKNNISELKFYMILKNNVWILSFLVILLLKNRGVSKKHIMFNFLVAILLGFDNLPK